MTPTDFLDAHPLIREYFESELRSKHPAAWSEGHNRLYQYLKADAKEYPETLTDMMPLFAAVTHGCHAGRHQEVFDDVYMRRIQRGADSYSVMQLGAFGANLSALACFFDTPWRQPVGGIDQRSRALVLGRAGFYLRTLGRMRDGHHLMEAGLKASVAEEDWPSAERCARHLSGYFRISGDLGSALAYADQSIVLADRSGDLFARIAARTTRAYVLHHCGDMNAAEEGFRGAEELQKQHDAQSRILYSYPGFRYCELLLAMGRFAEVLDRAKQNLKREKKAYPLYDVANDNLAMGLGLLQKAQKESTSDCVLARYHLEKAVEAQRQAGYRDELPRGLMARAALRRLEGNAELATRDLFEAIEIATRSGMKLHEADCQLELSRLYLAQHRLAPDAGYAAKARQSLVIAKSMIHQMGYHRRDVNVRELEQGLA